MNLSINRDSKLNERKVSEFDVENIDSAVRVYLLIDTSSSLKKYKEKLNSAIKSTIFALKDSAKEGNSFASVAVFINIIYFNNSITHSVKNQILQDVNEDDIVINPTSCTNLGKALNYTVELAKEEYAQDKAKCGVCINGEREQCHLTHPIIVLFTDGIPDAGVESTEAEMRSYIENFKNVAKDIRESEKNKKLTMLALSFKNDAYGNSLIKLVSKNEEHFHEAEDDEGLMLFFSQKLPQFIIKETTTTTEHVSISPSNKF